MDEIKNETSGVHVTNGALSIAATLDDFDFDFVIIIEVFDKITRFSLNEILADFIHPIRFLPSNESKQLYPNS